MPRLPQRSGLGSGLAALLLLGALAACADDTKTAAASGEDPAAPSEPTESTEVTASSEPSEPSEEPTETASEEPTEPAPGSGLAPRLLTAAELPGVNDETVWTEESTVPVKGQALGTCQRFDFLSMGADEGVARTFTSNQDTVVGVHVVSTFADGKSAWRAHEVLKTWAKKCAEHVEAGEVKVSQVRSLPAGSGSAQSYVVTHGDKGAEDLHFVGVGIARQGPLLALVEIDLVGQDYNYPDGEEPGSLAALAALQKLG
jgi:hypothetical protein